MRNICALGVLSCAVAACASQGSEAAQRAADTAGRRDSIAAVAVSSMNESHVLGLLERTHAADSALGALGAGKGTWPDVKEFGRMVLREHHALRRDVIDIGRKLGLEPQAPLVDPDAPPAAAREALETTDAGAAWDREYLDYAIALHQSAMENTARALAATHRAELKAFIEKSVPILQKHLDKARSLRKAAPPPPVPAAAANAKKS